MFVEYGGSEYFSYYEGQLIQGQVGNRMFDLIHVPLDREEILFYMLEGRTPKIRFNFIENENLEGVKPGDFVSIYLYTDYRENVLLVPINSLYSSAGEGTYVYLMIDGEKVRQRVDTGLRNESFAEIRDGLEEGDEVFVKQ